MAERFWQAEAGRAFVGRLETGDDLVEEIERLAATHDIRAAWITVIGAVRKAAFAYYQQEDRRYVVLESATHHEITGFVGNLSMREGSHFLHAHATFCDADGQAVGGHLLRGTEVFAAEITIREMTGVELDRHPDDATGLMLW
ncbi:MAG TPA: PPC domain-containing DNA-binding protein [Candidatus Limnocylindria bacterium]|nr:PPC domain-containing DNA-binding protein [Candidatus Limnocylindria bacterium]